ncbi:MAG: hypothetical protein HY673_14180 [Chloroflexi bacterium]|nr:hypothetical protein [Chloroflexota bacterium]
MKLVGKILTPRGTCIRTELADVNLVLREWYTPKVDAPKVDKRGTPFIEIDGMFQGKGCRFHASLLPGVIAQLQAVLASNEYKTLMASLPSGAVTTLPAAEAAKAYVAELVKLGIDLAVAKTAAEAKFNVKFTSAPTPPPAPAPAPAVVIDDLGTVAANMVVTVPKRSRRTAS